MTDSAGAQPGRPAPGPSTRPSTFSLEGRAAPALYLIGWLGSGMGLGIIVLSVAASANAAAPWMFLAGLVILGVGLVSATGSQAVERGRLVDLPYRGPSPVLVLLTVIVLTLLAIVVVLAPLSAMGMDAQSPVALTISLLLTTLIYVAVLRLLVVGPGALSWREMGLHAAATPAVRDLLLGALFAIPALGVTLVLGGVLAWYLEPSPSVLPESGNALGLAANLVSAAILAPVGEELFFRGFATTAWARTNGAGPAIVRGAVFFAFAHVLTMTDASFATGAERALFSFIALLPLGLILGWVFLSRRSLYVAIGLHATFNAIQVLALFAAAAAT